MRNAIVLFLIYAALTMPIGGVTSGLGERDLVWGNLLVTPANARPRGHVRRDVRRGARRTTRRVVRRASVTGCPLRSGYYYCGGVYYRPIVEDGVTIYVVVNP